MSISKIRVKSAVAKHNYNESTSAYNTSITTTNVTDTGTATTKLFKRDSPKNLQKQKSKILSLPTATTTTNTNGGGAAAKFSNKIPYDAAIVAGITATTTSTTTTAATTISIYNTGIPNNPGINNANNNTNATATPAANTNTNATLPQSTLLKIEPFVPSLATRLQKPFRRSYSTLSTATLKKRLHNVNTNLPVNLEISNNNNKKTTTTTATTTTTTVHGTINVDSTLGSAANNNNSGSSNISAQTAPTAFTLTKVPKPGQTLRRRQPLRGTLNRQRSKSTSSSNSASNRPATALVSGTNKVTTPTLGTPCSSPHNAVVIPQPNGICRIQRNAKEQEKLPDRINYDKRGLTAIPIFEKETNLRLLSLQHNLINTFHIPKEMKMESNLEKDAIEGTAVNATARPTELQITNSGNLAINKPRFPQNITSPNSEYASVPSNALNVSSPSNPGSFNAYMVQRNKFLHRSINLNNVTLQQNGPMHQTGSPLRFALRKSKSFVNNFNLQYQISKRNLQNPRANFLKKVEGSSHLKSFDSSTSNLTTDSASTAPTPDIAEEEDDMKVSELGIKNRQLLANYGNIFQQLVFLDLYDNQIERISNLDGLCTLSVLLLGKNRISDISGLASLKSTLKVLDLHGNKICSIANKINCLKELKSLNLAGNQIRQINQMDFLGLSNLKELNLKRNKLKRINGFQHLSSLERLWLCHNDLHKVDDMSSIAQACNLIEVTIENNPVSLAGDCVSFLVSYLPKLQTLSQMPITEQVRKAAMTWRANKELSDQSSQMGNKEQFNLIRREEIISNARTNWELLRSQQMLQQNIAANSSSSSSSSNNNDNSNNGSNSTSSVSHKKLSKSSKLNGELERITEANEQSYEEFIKLPPIEAKQEDHQQDKDKEERTSSASSLGPNVNSSSSCYSSGEDDDVVQQKTKNDNENSLNAKPKQNKIHANDSEIISAINGQQLTDAKNDRDSLANSSLPPTLTIQFPSEGISSKFANIPQSQYQTSNQTNLINGSITTATTIGSCSSIVQASTSIPAALSTSPSPSPLSSVVTTGPLYKRYMTGTLTRSQTIMGTGAANGYAMKATTTTTTTTMIASSNNSTTRQHGAKQSSSYTTSQTVTTTTTTTTSAAAAVGVALTAHQQQTVIAAPMTPMPAQQGVSSTANSPKHQTNSMATVNASGFGGCLTAVHHSNKLTPTSHNIASLTVAAPSSSKLSAIEREREQGGDYLIEICGRYLNIYGHGALRFIDKQWNPTKASDVHTLNFSYINFNNITTVLGRIKVRFPHAENFVFRETNINSLGQLNALAELQGITSLTIDPEGNSITSKDLWRQYAIYRLSHWGLKTLNNIEVTPQDRDKANHMYAGLSELILWSMPDVMLQPLLTRLRLDESCTASKMLPKQWLQKPDNRSLRLVVGKEALQWKKSNHQESSHGLPTPQQIRQLQAQFYTGVTCTGDVVNQMLSLSTPSPTTSSGQLPSINSLSAAVVAAMAATTASATLPLTQRERGKIHFTIMMENTCNAVEKLHKLEQIWPTMLLNIVRNTLLDYTQLDVYIRDLMADIMK